MYENNSAYEFIDCSLTLKIIPYHYNDVDVLIERKFGEGGKMKETRGQSWVIAIFARNTRNIYRDGYTWHPIATYRVLLSARGIEDLFARWFPASPGLR